MTMLKILKPGLSDVVFKYKRFDCNRCKCVFVTDEYSTAITGTNDYIFTATCPKCGAYTFNYSEDYCTEDGIYGRE